MERLEEGEESRSGGARLHQIRQIRPFMRRGPGGAPEGRSGGWGWTAVKTQAAKSEACRERVCQNWVTIITITFFEVERLLASCSHACCLCPPVIISSTCCLFWHFLCTNHQRSEVKPWDSSFFYIYLSNLLKRSYATSLMNSFRARADLQWCKRWSVPQTKLYICILHMLNINIKLNVVHELLYDILWCSCFLLRLERTIRFIIVN